MVDFSVDSAIKCIKSIIVNTQCMTCDKLVGPCVRFSCGHSVCEGCAQRIGECLYCISSPASYHIDKPQSARLSNSAALLNAFQDTFKIDVNKRQRISDHLRLEKQVFPECIQAPNKYGNKRKSINSSFKNKENTSPKYFSGEKTKSSNTVIMKKSAQYVQNWLNKHESMPQNFPRRPFGDINVNTQALIPKTTKDILKPKIVTAQVSPRKSTYRVRSHLKTIHKSPSSLLNNVVETNSQIKNVQRHREIKEEKTFAANLIHHKCDNNESGIVLDDEPIVIDEDVNVDKDEQAWLAVLEAAEKDENEDKKKDKSFLCVEKKTVNSLSNVDKMDGSTLVENENNAKNINSNIANKVLFFKKSHLFETCKLCNHLLEPKINSKSKVSNSNDVSIVINNATFITTIKFTKYENKNSIIGKSSVGIQTEKDMLLHRETSNVDKKIAPHKRITTANDGVPKKKLKSNDISHSLDVFDTEKETKPDSSNSSKLRRCVIIEDSDTDSSINCDNTHEVTVDIHRSRVPENVDGGILRTLSTMEYEYKTKRQARGITPNSSNSSDKENLDPNRKKIMKLGKKHKNKNKQQ